VLRLPRNFDAASDGTGTAKQTIQPASERVLLDRSAHRAFEQGKYAQAAPQP
jgi:hypothetical protein